MVRPSDAHVEKPISQLIRAVGAARGQPGLDSRNGSSKGERGAAEMETGSQRGRNEGGNCNDLGKENNVQRISLLVYLQFFAVIQCHAGSVLRLSDLTRETSKTNNSLLWRVYYPK